MTSSASKTQPQARALPCPPLTRAHPPETQQNGGEALPAWPSHFQKPLAMVELIPLSQSPWCVPQTEHREEGLACSPLTWPSCKQPPPQQSSLLEGPGGGCREPAERRPGVPHSPVLTGLEDPLQVPVELPLDLLLPAELQKGPAVLHPLTLLGKLSVMGKARAGGRSGGYKLTYRPHLYSQRHQEPGRGQDRGSGPRATPPGGSHHPGLCPPEHLQGPGKCSHLGPLQYTGTAPQCPERGSTAPWPRAGLGAHPLRAGPRPLDRDRQRAYGQEPSIGLSPFFFGWFRPSAMLEGGTGRNQISSGRPETGRQSSVTRPLCRPGPSAPAPPQLSFQAHRARRKPCTRTRLGSGAHSAGRRAPRATSRPVPCRSSSFWSTERPLSQPWRGRGLGSDQDGPRA